MIELLIALKTDLTHSGFVNINIKKLKSQY